ncbi:probable mitochondrial saccharopine dehydrogenase-like oxidoreductase At5g39410 [Cryptomeria japonica]|uniref:probable mitochondrial saccharopine dehydrogenase-like oxidoreductase At5g39410 n=1 Tax=Cryptomeria japonica TaxID=3369 RepID=UPI0027DA4C8C|nr:probable mitochondrial saccharopine dehydrogenase-like oxidoreductase At5g39410 [Cryptomeria japonica]
MGDRGLDAVILGASGFVAKYILREFMRHLERADGQGRRRIGIAGHNREKLAKALQWAAQGALQMPLLIPVIEAGVMDSASMAALCKRTQLIVNYVGPFCLYGESVVAAYVEAGIDYLDITGEQKFMEMMEEHYHSLALLTGSLIISTPVPMIMLPPTSVSYFIAGSGSHCSCLTAWMRMWFWSLRSELC